MENEILNINWHRRRLLLLAMNKYRTRTEQAYILGVSSNTVKAMIEEFDVEKVSGIYVSNKKIMLAVEV